MLWYISTSYKTKKHILYQSFKPFNIGELLGWLLKEEYYREESIMPVF